MNCFNWIHRTRTLNHKILTYVLYMFCTHAVLKLHVDCTYKYTLHHALCKTVGEKIHYSFKILFKKS